MLIASEGLFGNNTVFDLEGKFDLWKSVLIIYGVKTAIMNVFLSVILIDTSQVVSMY